MTVLGYLKVLAGAILAGVILSLLAVLPQEQK